MALSVDKTFCYTPSPALEEFRKNMAVFMLRLGHDPDIEHILVIDNWKVQIPCKCCHMKGDIVVSYENEIMYQGDALMNNCRHTK